LKDLLEIQCYTQVFGYPSLLVNEQPVDVEVFSKQEEIISWLR